MSRPNQTQQRKKRKWKKWKTPTKEKKILTSDACVGSNLWVSERYNMTKPKKSVKLSVDEVEYCKRTMPVIPKLTQKYRRNHQNTAERLGWTLHENKTWTHMTYKDKVFPSLVEKIDGEKYYVPFGKDPLGIAFTFKIQHNLKGKTIYQNSWNMEELHTRKGRRREKFRMKARELKTIIYN
jgi:hypothetical protein